MFFYETLSTWHINACYPTCLCISDKGHTTVPSVKVVLGGTTDAVMHNWMPDGDKNCLLEGLYGTCGKDGRICNQAWWWCDAPCDYQIAINDSYLQCVNNWQAVPAVKSLWWVSSKISLCRAHAPETLRIFWFTIKWFAFVKSCFHLIDFFNFKKLQSMILNITISFHFMVNSRSDFSPGNIRHLKGFLNSCLSVCQYSMRN